MNLGGTKKFIKQYWVELVLSLVLAIILGATTFLHQLPFKSYGDVWAHLAFVEELKKPFGEIGDPYFNDSTKDPHNGVYPVLIAVISNITGLNHIVMMQIGGIISTIFLFWVLTWSYSVFYPERKKYNVDKVVLFVLAFLGWESIRLSYAGYFSLADIAIGIMFPHMFALALFIIAATQYYILLEKQAKVKKITPEIASLIGALGILSAFILITHVITGVILFYTYGLFTLYHFIFELRFKLRPIYFFNALIAVLALFICILWPYYNFIDPFTKLQTIHTEVPITSIFEVNDWILVAGMLFLGIFVGLFNKNKMLVFWLGGMLFILASYLYPIRISSYWRFFPITLIPLVLLFVNWISTRDRSVRTYIIFLLIAFGMTSFINKVDTIGYRAPITPTIFSFLQIVPKDKLVFSDPESSYLFAGVSGHPVMVVTKNHWNPANHALSEERYLDSNAFWHANNETGSTYIIDKYNIEYVLINKRIYRNFDEYAVLLGSKYRTSELYQDRNYLLLYIKR